jgi:MFS family permease
LAVRNFRIYFISQGISMTGTWMQQIAQMWLVLRLTNSGVALGLTAALQFLPILVFGAWGGLIADRGDKRKLLLATQTLAGALAAGLAALTLTGSVRLWMVYGFAAGLGLVNCVDNPTRQSFVIELVGAPNAANAVSVNTTMFTIARIIGPATGGLVIASIGLGYSFLINAISFVAVIGGLLMMRSSEFHRSQPLERAKGQVREGIRYAWANPPIRLSLVVMSVIGTLGFNLGVLFPLFAHETFHSGPQTFGIFMALLGLGAFIGALFSAVRSRPTPNLLLGSALIFGALLVGVGSMPTLILEMAILVPTGAAMMLYQVTSNATIQVNADTVFRGRVMALYIIVFLGTTPIGGPLVGWMAQEWGPRLALAVGGVATMLTAIIGLAWRFRTAHPTSGAGPLSETVELRRLAQH